MVLLNSTLYWEPLIVRQWNFLFTWTTTPFKMGGTDKRFQFILKLEVEEIIAPQLIGVIFKKNEWNKGNIVLTVDHFSYSFLSQISVMNSVLTSLNYTIECKWIAKKYKKLLDLFDGLNGKNAKKASPQRNL